MKKSFIIIIIIIIAIFVLIFAKGIKKNAGNNEVTIIADKTKVQTGEEFSIIVSANCSDGINGVETTISYDKDSLELISKSVVDDDHFTKIATEIEKGLNVVILSESSNKIEKADLFKLVFKVKENTTASTIKVIANDVNLGSDTAQYYQLGTKSVEIKLKNN